MKINSLLAVTLSLVLVVGLGTQYAFAETKTYVGPDNGIWDDPSNWNPPGIPDDDDDKVIFSVGAVHITSNVVNGPLGSITIDNLVNFWIDAGASLTNQGTFTMLNGMNNDILVTGLLINECTGIISLDEVGMITVPGLFGMPGTFVNHGSVIDGTLPGGPSDFDNNIIIRSGGLVQSSTSLPATKVDTNGVLESIPSICVVGGEFLSLDTTALMLAGLQTSAVWMLPTLAGLAGAGYYLIKFRANKE